jgi:hypothetical protein
MKNLNYIVILLFVCSCDHATQNNCPIISHTSYNPLNSYYYDTNAVTIELPVLLIDTAGSSFTLEVTRQVGYEPAKRLTEKAESFFPPDSMVNELGFIDTSAIAESLWWYEELDGTRVPYAITGSAIEYYINRIRWYRQNTSSMISAYFKYNSTFEYYYDCIVGNTKYEEVFIVVQEMQWMQYCGPLCAMGFTRKRIIIFDKNEDIIAIIGDSRGAWIS